MSSVIRAFIASANAVAALACQRDLRGLQVDADVPYGPDQRQTITFARLPNGGSYRPAVLLVHGGGWIEGDKSELERDWVRPLAEAGFIVANVGYRLAPKAVAPAAIVDVRAAANWICRNASRYDIDVRRLAFMGMSAGGHLALMAALPPVENSDLGTSCRPAVVVNLWGITDIEDVLEGGNPRSFTASWVPPKHRDRELLARWSPITWASAVGPNRPFVLTIHARHDQIVPFAHGERLTAKLGTRAELVAFEGDWHAPSSEDYPAVLATLLEFLKRNLQ